MKIRALAFAAASCLAMNAGASCKTSHYYNHSPRAWEIIVAGADVKECPTLYMFLSGKKCMLEPGKTLTVEGSNYSLGIKDYTGNVRYFDVARKSGRIDACPYIKHSGNTGSVAVNDPADGDINIWGPDRW